MKVQSPSLWSYNTNQFEEWCKTRGLDTATIERFWNDRARYRTGDKPTNFLLYYGFQKDPFFYTDYSRKTERMADRAYRNYKERHYDEDYLYIPILSAATLYLMITVFMSDRENTNPIGSADYCFRQYNQFLLCARDNQDPSISILTELFRQHKNYTPLSELLSSYQAMTKAFTSMYSWLSYSTGNDQLSTEPPLSLSETMKMEYDTEYALLIEKLNELSDGTEPQYHTESPNEKTLKKFTKQIRQGFETEYRESIRKLWIEILQDIYALTSNIYIEEHELKRLRKRFYSEAGEFLDRITIIKKACSELIAAGERYTSDSGSASKRKWNAFYSELYSILSSPKSKAERSAWIRLLDAEISSFLFHYSMGTRVDGSQDIPRAIRIVGPIENSVYDLAAALAEKYPDYTEEVIQENISFLFESKELKSAPSYELQKRARELRTLNCPDI